MHTDFSPGASAKPKQPLKAIANISMSRLIASTPNVTKFGVNGVIQTALRKHGEVVGSKMGPFNAVFISHPELIRQILISNKENYSKDNPLFNDFKRVVGNGIFLSEGKFWRSQRRIMQPEFTPKGVDQLVSDMGEIAAAVSTEWDLKRRKGQTINVVYSMQEAAMRVICKTVLGVDVGGDATWLGRAIDRLTMTVQLPNTLPGWANKSLTPISHRLQQRYADQLDLFIGSVIDQNKFQQQDGIVNRLISAADPETGRSMSLEQLRDEIVVLFIAGHETTANSLAWAWYLLSRNPRAKQEIQKELDSVLAGRIPTSEDLKKLPYTRAVFDEALRLYPTIPFIARSAVSDDQLGGYLLPAGTMVVPSFYATHLRPDLWDSPTEFRPERFLPQNNDLIVKDAYLPFGAGPRTCMGNHFAIAEGQVMLATLAQRFDFEPATDTEIYPTRLVGALRSAKAIKLRLTSRMN